MLLELPSTTCVMDLCSLAGAFAFMSTPSRADTEVAYRPPVWSGVLDVCKVVLNAVGKWDLSDIPLFAEIDVRSSLQADFNVNRDKCPEYLVEAPTTAASVFKFALAG